MSQLEEKEFSSKYDLTIWKNLFQYMKPYKNQFIILALFMIFLAGFDAGLAYFAMYAIDNFVGANTTDGLGTFAIIYSTVIIVTSISVYIFIRIAGRIEVGVAYKLRDLGFRKLQKLSFSYYDKTAVGWMMSRVTSDVNRISEILSWGLVDMFWGSTMMVMIAVVMLTVNVKLGLITLTVVPLLAVASVFFQQRILKTSRAVRKINSKITGAFNEGITGAKTSKTLVREKRNLGEFQSITEDMRRGSVKSAIYSSAYLPIAINIGSLGMALAVTFGGKMVLNTEISFGTFYLFITYAVLMFEPVRELARVFADLQVAQASAERVLSMIDTPLDLFDEEHVIQIYGDTFIPKKENWETIQGSIEFKDVKFHYTKDEVILDNFNLKVNAGETIALVGETGSGKSTLVNLACRFYEPVAGQVLIDNKDYRERSQLWLHSNIGFVLQTPHLFSGTIKENIRYGNLEASELDIIKASKLVNAHDLIMKFEKGYDTEVGEGGAKLSTGEKQLVSFARAIVANPSIFILDEATSSVDTETEMVIQDAINNILKGRTSFIVAHRLSTIRNADRILVMKKGVIVEDGNHDALMKQKGYYYKLYTNQFIDEKELEVLKKA